MRKRHLYLDRKSKLVPALRESGDLTLYIFLCSLKSIQRDVSKLSLFEVRNAHEKLAYSENTIRKYVNDLVRKGWAFKSKKHLYLKSYRDIAATYRIRVTKKVEFCGGSSKDLMSRVALNYLTINRRKVAKKAGINDRKISASIHCFSLGCETGVRWVSKVLGYKSAMSGHNIYKHLESKGEIQRYRRNSVVCPLSEFSGGTMEEYGGRLWVDWRRKVVMRRETSNLRLVSLRERVNAN